MSFSSWVHNDHLNSVTSLVDQVLEMVCSGNMVISVMEFHKKHQNQLF